MSKTTRDDHFIPQTLLRQWGLSSDNVSYRYINSNGHYEIGIQSINKKIKVFSKLNYDKFFNLNTLSEDDLNKYRQEFENKVRRKVKDVLRKCKDLRRKILLNASNTNESYSFLSLSDMERKFWIRYYLLNVVTNPHFNVFLEKAFRNFLRKEGSNQKLLELSNGFRIIPSLLIEEEFTKYVMNFSEVYINFFCPDREGEFFLASDSYIPPAQYQSFKNTLMLHIIPLHPELLLKVFHQDGTEEKEKQTRVCFQNPSILDQEALNYGTEILGTDSQLEYIRLNTQIKT